MRRLVHGPTSSEKSASPVDLVVVSALRTAFGRRRFLFRRPLQKPVQAGAADAQHLRGPHAIAIAHFQYALDVRATHFIERQRTSVFYHGSRAAVCSLQVRRQIV
jgi:hypothetical protein